MSIPLLDLKPQYQALRDELKVVVERVMDAQAFILGPEVEGLEREVAGYSHCRFGVGVSSGTDALLMALMALDIKPGDEVITSPFTFFATAGSIARLGATPVFADIDPVTFNIDPAAIEKVITTKTRAIMPVHLYGQMADMDPIMAIATHHRLVVIEDAAQAIGAEYKCRRAGSIGQIGCFSLFHSKSLGGIGDGGMVTTNDPDLAARMRLLRAHGAQPKYYHQLLGGNFRLDAVQAAVVRVKLNYLDEWTDARQRNATRYRELLADVGVTLPTDAGYGRHIYNQFVIRSEQRDALMAHLKARQIGTEIYYPLPMHLQECFTDLGYQQGDFPASERAALETLAIPVYPELSDEQQHAVVRAVAESMNVVLRTA